MNNYQNIIDRIKQIEQYVGMEDSGNGQGSLIDKIENLITLDDRLFPNVGPMFNKNFYFDSKNTSDINISMPSDLNNTYIIEMKLEHGGMTEFIRFLKEKNKEYRDNSIYFSFNCNFNAKLYINNKLYKYLTAYTSGYKIQVGGYDKYYYSGGNYEQAHTLSDNKIINSMYTSASVTNSSTDGTISGHRSTKTDNYLKPIPLKFINSIKIKDIKIENLTYKRLDNEGNDFDTNLGNSTDNKLYNEVIDKLINQYNNNKIYFSFSIQYGKYYDYNPVE